MLRKVINGVLGVFRFGRRSDDEMSVDEEAKAKPEESDTESGEEEHGDIPQVPEPHHRHVVVYRLRERISTIRKSSECLRVGLRLSK